MLRLLKAAAFGLLLGLLGILASVIEEVRELEENVGLGLLFHLRGAVKPPDDAVVVAIDRESSERLKLPNNPDRWPRSLHARLIETLNRAGARVIVFDVYFAEPRSAEEDGALAEAIKQAGNVVLAEQLRAKDIVDTDAHPPGHKVVETVKPIEAFLHAAFATAPFVLPRMPVRVSQYWTFQTAAGDAPTFPVLALQLYTLQAYPEIRALLEKASPKQAVLLPPDPGVAIQSAGAARFIKDVRQAIRGDLAVGDRLVSLAAGAGSERGPLGALAHLYTGANRQYINFYGPPRSVTTLPYYQALQLGQLGDDAANNAAVSVRGKAVFVGLSENLLAERQDSFHTVYSTTSGVFISGVEIAATAFLNLLTNRAVKPATPGYQILTLLLWGMLVGTLCRMAAPLTAGIGVVLCGAAYLVAASYHFSADAIWFPIVVPLFLQAPVGYVGALSWNYFEINKERKRITSALGYYVPEEVVTQVARNMVDIRRYGQTVYGACLFADIAGYTPVSESLSPRELSDLMHKYLEAAFEQIYKQGGLAVELKGDSILAIWKGSWGELGFRQKACEGALDMAEAVRRFNRLADKAITLPTRISIHAGPIYLGNIGAGSHYEYAVTGDTVTTGARLDGLNKYLGTSILVTDEAARGLEGFLTRPVGIFLLKGKTQPILAHELICRSADSADGQKVACTIFAEARQAFERRLWDEADEKFKQSEQLFAGDGVSRFFRDRCAQYRANPPPDDWNGVIVMDEK